MDKKQQVPKDSAKIIYMLAISQIFLQIPNPSVLGLYLGKLKGLD